jgi:universal stress protein A
MLVVTINVDVLPLSNIDTTSKQPKRYTIMSAYKHILVGLDLSPESNQVTERVKFLFTHTNTKISVCHILEPLSFTYGGDIPVDLSDVQKQLTDQATKRLAIYATELQVEAADQHVILGHPAQEMHGMAASNDIDLIVVGSHGRHGLSLIFGSTSNSVLHGASCDVLAVRITD